MIYDIGDYIIFLLITGPVETYLRRCMCEVATIIVNDFPSIFPSFLGVLLHELFSVRDTKITSRISVSFTHSLTF